MRSLITSQAQTAQAEQVRQTLARIQAWPHWEEIGWCARKEYAVSAGQFAERLPEYQRFLALCAVSPDLGMTSAAIDQLWHAHILHTARYEQFCTEILGRFLHHLPCSSYPLYGVDPAPTEADDDCTTCQLPSIPTTCFGQRAATAAETPQAEAIRAGGARFRQAYRAVFGEPPAIWSCRTPARLEVERLVQAALASPEGE